MTSRQRPGTGGRPASRTLSRPRSRERDSAPTREKNAARQAARRREASSATPPAKPRRRNGRLTRRAAVLALVVCALVLSLAYPLKQYLAENSRVAVLAQQNAQKQAQVDELERRKAQLKDPAYITMLARERLQYVVPGESQLVVIREGQTGAAADESTKAHSTGSAPWYSQLWGSVQKADRAP
ncbi:MAG TPA: septum formation initiator family protein [Mycobacteriales bacterium]|nr:septum formation initiator family protein [Mycobacteriales bacterium]